MSELTLSILKPDLVAKNKTGEVNSRLQSASLRIVAQKMIQMSQQQAKTFYAEHAEQPFFADLVEFMTSGPCVVQVLQGEDAIALNRKLMGATDPADADAGTIRADFADHVGANAVHGSDSAASAKREIAIFFADAEIFDG